MIKNTLLIVTLSIVGAGAAHAVDCAMDFQHAYEKGVERGRADGGQLASKDPTRWKSGRRHKGTDRNHCFKKGYKIGYDNAYADAKKREKKHKHEGRPPEGTNERAYYDDGCHEGTTDAQNNMSMAYERHHEMYDRRFKAAFVRGYENCWRHHRR